MEIKSDLNEISIGGKSYEVKKEPNSDGSVNYFFQGENGDAEMTVYTVSLGIKVILNSVHTDRSFLSFAKEENSVEIHHCREGRMECPSDNGYFYLMPGDLAVESTAGANGEYVFPLRHYHGITVSVRTDIARECFSCFLGDVDVDPVCVLKRLCGDGGSFVIRSRDYIGHLFSEMYNVPCENKKGYYKIKTAELFLILGGVDPNENSVSSHTLSVYQADIAKRAAAYIAENTDGRITVGELAARFHISATHLQNAFKGVFGVPVSSYIRINKMNVAASMLVRTDKSVTEIAGECGYDNASKFASAFRAVMNEKPLEYRKSHRLLCRTRTRCKDR